MHKKLEEMNHQLASPNRMLEPVTIPGNENLWSTIKCLHNSSWGLFYRIWHDLEQQYADGGYCEPRRTDVLFTILDNTIVRWNCNRKCNRKLYQFHQRDLRKWNRVEFLTRTDFVFIVAKCSEPFVSCILSFKRVYKKNVEIRNKRRKNSPATKCTDCWPIVLYTGKWLPYISFCLIISLECRDNEMLTGPNTKVGKGLKLKKKYLR